MSSGPTTKTDADMSRAIRARERRTDENAVLRARVAELETENFALAANQCHDGYGDEWGNHCCHAIDKAVSECEFLAKEYEALRAQNAELVAALEEIALRHEEFPEKRDGYGSMAVMIARAALAAAGQPQGARG
jgi:hypothetical protein